MFVAVVVEAAAKEIGGVVVGVRDGDTITLLTAAKERVKIRLYGIDAPEAKQAFGQASKAALSALVYQREVKADVIDTDRYGRSIAVIFAAGENVNELQVASGMAWWYRHFAAKDKRLASLEASARSSEIGLWREKSPTPPWEFRKNARAGSR